MEIVLPQDRLDAHRLSLGQAILSGSVLEGLPRCLAELADQPRRSSCSVTLNVAEGRGEFSPKEKARFYRMASATECAAVLDLLHRSNVLPESRYREGRTIVHPLVGTLTRLVKRHGSGPESLGRTGAIGSDLDDTR